MARGNPVHGVVIVRYPQAVPGQLLTKSYRPRSGGRRRRFQCSHPFGELLGTADQRLPDALAGRRVEGGEDLAAEAVEDRQPLPRRSRLLDPAGERVKGADASRRQPARGSEAAGGGDPDPQPGEGTGAETDRDQVDLRPAAGSRDGALYLGQQRGRVPGPAGRREP
ncbi:MAG TPA: hypothetical protein VLL27_14555 [Solirubrobacterales bacterium]|nr:hypothetical protein [Solirubrobacterales bacterium]